MDKKSIVLNYISIKPCDEFGVIDNKPCEILYEDKNKWQAICACNSRTDFKFLPIDNNRELEWLFKTSLKGNALKKCDCCLITQNKIRFIEIKIQHKDTFQDSKKQLSITITLFAENELINGKKKYAFVCTDALTSSSHQTDMSEFWREYRTHLYIKDGENGKIITEL